MVGRLQALEIPAGQTVLNLVRERGVPAVIVNPSAPSGRATSSQRRPAA